MERQRPLEKKGFMKRTFDKLRTSPRSVTNPDDRPGYYVRGGDVPASGLDSNLTSEQIHTVLDQITPELARKAQKELAATPVDEDIFDSARDVIRQVAELRTEVHDLRERISNEFHGMPPGVNIDDFDKE